MSFVGSNPCPSISDFDEDCGGLFAICIVREAAVLDWIAAGLDGSALGQAFVLSLTDWMARVGTAGFQCADRDEEFSPRTLPREFVMLLPHRDDPSVSLMSDLCQRCSRRLDTERKLIWALKKRLRSIWPQLREIDPAVITAVGRA